MKRALLFVILFAIIGLVSCDEDNCYSIPKETSNVTFNITTLTPQTKVANITRYIVEIYKVSDPETVVKRVEKSCATIIVSLENDINYTCLFWADGVELNNNTTGVYDATDLKNVTLNSGKEMGEAFFARLDIVDAKKTFVVPLKRATAQVNIIETDYVSAYTDLEVKYDRYASFNTSTSEVTGAKVSTVKTFKSAAKTGRLGTLLAFASTGGVIADFTTIYDASVINSILNVPIKAHYKTDIHGRYSTKSNDFIVVITVDGNYDDIVDGVDINIGNTTNPNWIKVADRNADKNGPNRATVGNTATDYGYYYQWSNATNDPTNENKAYRACFDFAEGNGEWRLPTQEEVLAIMGSGGSIDNKTRKIDWDGTTWRLYDERIPNQKTKFVYFPLAGYNGAYHGSSASHDVGLYGFYWTSTPSSIHDDKIYFIFIVNTGWGSVRNDTMTFGFPVRCVKSI